MLKFYINEDGINNTSEFLSRFFPSFVINLIGSVNKNFVFRPNLKSYKFLLYFNKIITLLDNRQ